MRRQLGAGVFNGQHGLTIKRVAEPQPPENMINIPGMKDEMRQSMMLLVAAQQQE